MAQSRSRLKWIFLPIGFIVLAVAGKWAILISTAHGVHQTPESVPSSQSPNPSVQRAGAIARAQQLIRGEAVSQNLPGISVAVAAVKDAKAEILWAEGFGWSDIESQLPVTPDTRFRIGTASKTFTAAAIAALHQQGKLKLDDEIQTLVPQFPKKQWPLTLQHLVSESSGLGNDIEQDNALLRQRCEHPQEAIRHFADAPLLFQPGSQRQPSTRGWILLSAAVEAGSGQPFLTYLQDSIFQPLAMNSTGAESAKEENPERIGEEEEDPPLFTLIRHVVFKPFGLADIRKKPTGSPATLYEAGFGPEPIPQNNLHAPHTRNLSCYAGAMAFLSTPSDLLRFSLSSKATLPPNLNGEFKGRKLVSLITLPETGISVAVMSNSANTDTAALARNIAEAFKQ